MTLARVSLPFLLLLAGGCSLLVSESDVERDSVSYFEQLKKKEPISRDARLISYVDCVATAVAKQLEPAYSSREWEVVVFDDDQVNAFAIAGEKIGVYSGLFKVVEGQDQLATVLGHEMAHVTHQHTLKRAQRAMAMQGGVLVAGTALGGGAAYDLASMGAQLGIGLPFDRGDESAADKAGLKYMAAAGFDPRQSVPLWEKMAKNNKLGGPAFLTDHPSDETRLSALIKELPADLPLYNQARAAGRAPNCHR